MDSVEVSEKANEYSAWGMNDVITEVQRQARTTLEQNGWTLMESSSVSWIRAVQRNPRSDPAVVVKLTEPHLLMASYQATTVYFTSSITRKKERIPPKNWVITAMRNLITTASVLVFIGPARS